MLNCIVLYIKDVIGFRRHSLLLPCVAIGRMCSYARTDPLVNSVGLADATSLKLNHNGNYCDFAIKVLI